MYHFSFGIHILARPSTGQLHYTLKLAEYVIIIVLPVISKTDGIIYKTSYLFSTTGSYLSFHIFFFLVLSVPNFIVQTVILVQAIEMMHENVYRLQ